MLTVIEVSARWCPGSVEPVPSVAELADLPEHVAGLGAVDEVRRLLPRRWSGGADLEDEDRVRVALRRRGSACR